MPPKAKIIDNDEFVRKNFDKLIEKYAHERIVICRGEIFTGEDAVLKARQKYPNVVPMSLPVPSRPELISHIL